METREHFLQRVRTEIGEGLAPLHAAEIQSNRSREGSNTMFAYVYCKVFHIVLSVSFLYLYTTKNPATQGYEAKFSRTYLPHEVVVLYENIEMGGY